MTRLFLRIDFEPSGSALGLGMVQLLEGIAEHGSLRRAAAGMGMSYRKAWLLIQSVQKTFDGPVVTAEVGGATGGGTELTELGNTLLKLYRRVESRAADATKTELDQLSAMVRTTAAPRASVPLGTVNGPTTCAGQPGFAPNTKLSPRFNPLLAQLAAISRSAIGRLRKDAGLGNAKIRLPKSTKADGIFAR
jgi:molybdate transport system regulatory protein